MASGGPRDRTFVSTQLYSREQIYGRIINKITQLLMSLNQNCDIIYISKHNIICTIRGLEGEKLEWKSHLQTFVHIVCQEHCFLPPILLLAFIYFNIHWRLIHLIMLNNVSDFSVGTVSTLGNFFFSFWYIKAIWTLETAALKSNDVLFPYHCHRFFSQDVYLLPGALFLSIFPSMMTCRRWYFPFSLLFLYF